ncbi:sulfurtransferase-like selenium metabolism protein YedF [candidate division KSB1 bacterium]|nr:MAG: sulfurtransferase-like selenium metabolism protein YedF [candidate division KSB1 bacterium]
MKHTIVINSEFFGKGDDELGAKLMGSFLRTLLTSETKPDKIVFYNSGVKLLAEGSVMLDVLNDLNKSGVQLVACGTCVGFFKLDDKVARDRVSNMQEIVGVLMNSGSVVTV